MHPRIPSWQPGHAAGSWSPCRPPAPETGKPLWGADVTVTGSSGPTSSRPGAMLQEQGSNGGLGGDQQGEGAGASCTQLRKGQRKKLAMCRNVVVWHSLGNERRRKGLQCTQADLEVSSYTLPSCWARESTRSPEEAEVKTLRRTSVSSVLALGTARPLPHSRAEYDPPGSFLPPAPTNGATQPATALQSSTAISTIALSEHARSVLHLFPTSTPAQRRSSRRRAPLGRPPCRTRRVNPTQRRSSSVPGCHATRRP